MNFPLKIAVVCALVFMPQLNALNVFTRFLFSNKAYAKNIEVKAYILTNIQASALLADPSKEPTQFIGRELAKFPKQYLVVRVRNLGNSHAWGTLACSVPGIWDPLKIPIISIRKDFCDYLICVEGISVSYSHHTYAPNITYEWDKLYTK